MLDDLDMQEVRKTIRQEVRLQLADALAALAAQLRGGAVGAPVTDPKMIAVLAAAATAALGRPVVVKRATRSRTRRGVTQTSAWAEMGRSLVQSSHNLHRGN